MIIFIIWFIFPFYNTFKIIIIFILNNNIFIYFEKIKNMSLSKPEIISYAAASAAIGLMLAYFLVDKDDQQPQ